MRYKIFDTNRSIFADDIIIDARSMTEAVEKYLGDRLKPNQCVKKYAKGEFVVSKYPYGNRFVYSIFNK